MVDFCSSNVLWFIGEHIGEDGLSHVTSRDVALEFGVTDECAYEQLSLLCEAGFVQQISSDKYAITQCGKDECELLFQFVRRGKLRKINPRTAVKISVKLRKWFPGKTPDEIAYEMARLKADICNEKFKCTTEEFELAKRLMA